MRYLWTCMLLAGSVFASSLVSAADDGSAEMVRGSCRAQLLRAFPADRMENMHEAVRIEELLEQCDALPAAGVPEARPTAASFPTPPVHPALRLKSQTKEHDLGPMPGRVLTTSVWPFKLDATITAGAYDPFSGKRSFLITAARADDPSGSAPTGLQACPLQKEFSMAPGESCYAFIGNAAVKVAWKRAPLNAGVEALLTLDGWQTVEKH